MAAPMCKIVTKRSQIFFRVKQPFFAWRCFCTSNNRKLCQSDEKLPRSSFQQTIDARKDQAARSILVRLSGKTSENNLLQYCTSHGKVQHCFTYSQQPHGRYALVEFKSADGIDLILSRAYESNASSGQIQSRFLSFSGSGQSDQGETGHYQQVNKDCSFTELYAKLAQAESVSDQLDILTAEQELRDGETRLRFLVCSLIEEAFHKILPDCSLHLFGSSVNGFGRRSCDVDMYLERNTAHGVVPLQKGKGQYKLGYNRQSAESERATAQATLFALASYLEKQVPHCMSVSRILQAKCPLVKFRHHATGLSCDLTTDNSIALKSSELLHVFGQLDPRVRPLVFVIRHWARHHGITNRHPGYWITNFPLTLLVVFFLQSRAQPVVPSFDYLRSLADDEVKQIIDGLDCTIPGDLSQVMPSENTQTTAELLQEFFHFCTTFDFNFDSLSVRTGTARPKRDHSAPLHMENPFETELNMCKNVSLGLLQEIQKHSRFALQMMDVPGFHGPGGGSDVIHPWGIGALFAPLKAKRRKGKRSSLLDGAIGTVLEGLSRKTASSSKSGTSKKQPRNSNGNSATVSASKMDPEDASGRTLEPVDSLNGSPRPHDMRTANKDFSPSATDTSRPNTLDTADTDHQVQIKGVSNSDLGPHDTGKSKVPKLQITISNVRDRLFDRRHRRMPSGFIQ